MTDAYIGDLGCKFQVCCIYGSEKNACITTGSISGTCCNLLHITHYLLPAVSHP